MESIIEYENKYKGQPCGVLGGGPSLLDGLEKLPAESVLIAVNDHALPFCNPGYMVFMDMPGDVPELRRGVESFKGVKISQGAWSDVDLSGAKWWDGGFSSSLAAWFACWLGCDPVILCGMDCYQGEVKHIRPRSVDHPSFYYSVDKYLDAWTRGLPFIPGVERIKAMPPSPLGEIFGFFEA